MHEAERDHFFSDEVPRQDISPEELAALEDLKASLKLTGQWLWRQLFLVVSSEDDLARWESEIPSYQCRCKDDYLSWKANNPPTFPLTFEWKYSLKDHVNEKLGHLRLTLEEAMLYWSKERV